jgi:hypothetical protein
LRSANSSPGRTSIRKTSLLRIVPTACGQAADIALSRFGIWRIQVRSNLHSFELSSFNVASARRYRVCRANLHWRATADRRRARATLRFSSPRSLGTFNARRLRSVATLPSRSNPGAILPLHDVRYRARALKPRGFMADAKDVFSANEQPGWWSQTGSNRRPPACKAGALPTELWPLQVPETRSRQSGRPRGGVLILTPDRRFPETGGPGKT